MDDTEKLAPEDMQATEPAPATPPSAGTVAPTLDETTFMERVVDDARATGRTASLIMALRNLEARRANQTQQLEAVYLAIGRNAEDQCEWLVAQHEAGRDDPVTLTGRELLSVKEAQTQARAHIIERDKDVSAAQERLAQEEKKHTTIIVHLEDAYHTRQEDLKKRQDNVTAARSDIAGIENNIKKLCTRIEKARQADVADEPVEQLTAQRIKLEAGLAEPTARLEVANEQRAAAKRTVDDKNAELKAARANWRSIRSRLMDDVKTAQAAQARSVAQLRKTEADLARARTRHGEALFQAGDLPESCAELADQARKALQFIASMDAEYARKRKVLRRVKGGARRFVVLACVVFAIFVLGLILGYAIPRSSTLDHTRLITAAKADNLSEVKSLLDQGISADGVDADGRTALHWAANRGGVGLVKLLLTRGANVNARDNNGLTPLHAAACKDRREAAKLLLERGADIKALDKSGKTPLDQARERKFTQFVELLQEHPDKKETPTPAP